MKQKLLICLMSGILAGCGGFGDAPHVSINVEVFSPIFGVITLEYLSFEQNKEQVVNSIGALSKSIYSRSFQWLVDRVNETLDVKTKRAHFIGVLDIAGFEIFDVNFKYILFNF